MINLLYHIERLKQSGKRLDVLDYMWQEMRSVVIGNKVPIYGQYLQKLINTKVPQVLLNEYEFVKPTLLPLSGLVEDEEEDVAPVVPPSNKRARRTPSENVGSSQVEPQVEAPKKKNILKSIFQKMNCFFVDKQDKDYKAYAKQKQQNRNMRAIMTNLEFPYPASSEEVSENTYKSKNTYWLGDDASSLGPYWPGFYQVVVDCTIRLAFFP